VLLLDYDKVFDEALSCVLRDYSDNKINFYSERDLQGHLFYECRRLMEEQGFSCPLKLYAEKSVFDRRSKVDLVLGDNEVLVELKLEPDYPRVSKPVVFSTRREAGGPGSVEDDLEKIEKYASKGKFAHFIMIDEDGRHINRIALGKWKKISKRRSYRNRTIYYLHIIKDARIGLP
jgi:hypothetical protein